MSVDLEELKRLAREAQVNRDLVDGLHWQMATNPLAVLALIERVEELQREVAMLNEALAEEHAKAEGAYARGIEVHADALVALEAFATNFSATVESDLANEDAWNKGGMRPATLTGDSVRLPPSARERLRWWAERAKEALGTGKEGAK